MPGSEVGWPVGLGLSGVGVGGGPSWAPEMKTVWVRASRAMVRAPRSVGEGLDGDVVVGTSVGVGGGVFVGDDGEGAVVVGGEEEMAGVVECGFVGAGADGGGGDDFAGGGVEYGHDAVAAGSIEAAGGGRIDQRRGRAAGGGGPGGGDLHGFGVDAEDSERSSMATKMRPWPSAAEKRGGRRGGGWTRS